MLEFDQVYVSSWSCLGQLVSMKSVSLFDIYSQFRSFLNSFFFFFFFLVVVCVQGVICLNTLGEFRLSGDYV